PPEPWTLGIYRSGYVFAHSIVALIPPGEGSYSNLTEYISFNPANTWGPGNWSTGKATNISEYPREIESIPVSALTADHLINERWPDIADNKNNPEYTSSTALWFMNCIYYSDFEFEYGKTYDELINK
ncbi:hypothetical protein LCGC14_2206850, partial [marine sediment metagenome]